MLYFPTLISIIKVLLLFIPVFLAIAFVTVAERKTMASMQRRLGPKFVGYYGLLQAFASMYKLIVNARAPAPHSFATLPIRSTIGFAEITGIILGHKIFTSFGILLSLLVVTILADGLPGGGSPLDYIFIHGRPGVFMAQLRNSGQDFFTLSAQDLYNFLTTSLGIITMLQNENTKLKMQIEDLNNQISNACLPQPYVSFGLGIAVLSIGLGLLVAGYLLVFFITYATPNILYFF